MIYWIFVVSDQLRLWGCCLRMADLPHTRRPTSSALLINFFTLAFVFVVPLDYLLKQQPLKPTEK